MRAILRTFIVLLLAPTSALAHGGSHPADPNLHVDSALEDCEVHFSHKLSQQAFRRFAREFGSAGAFQQMAPPNTLGKWGISIGVEYMRFSVDQKADAWNDTFSHPTADHELGNDLAFPKLKLRVGISEDTDVGLFYAMNPSSNYGWIGADVKHALLQQSATMPVTLSLRGAYTKTLFVSDMDMHAVTGDVSAGRTFWNTLTPYLGVGGDLVLALETASTVDLDPEAPAAPHAFAGVEVAFWHLALGVEGKLAALPTAQVQVSAVF